MFNVHEFVCTLVFIHFETFTQKRKCMQLFKEPCLCVISCMPQTCNMGAGTYANSVEYPSCYLGRKAITVQLPYSLIIKFFLPNPLYESTETPARCLQNLGKCQMANGKHRAEPFQGQRSKAFWTDMSTWYRIQDNLRSRNFP